MITSQEATRTGNTRLHFIGHKEYTMLVTEVVTSLQITLIRYHYTGLTLYRLEQESGNTVPLALQNLPQLLYIIVLYLSKPRCKGTIVGIAGGVATHRYNTNGASVEVAITNHYNRFVFGHSLYPISPAAC